MSRLYLEHFGLHRPPFNITPDPRVFFAGAQRGALCEAIEHAVFDTPGIVLVVGEVGSGKTMLCRLLAQRLQARACDLIYLANPAFAPQEILRSMLADLGEDAGGDTPLLRLQQALLARHQQGRSVVLLIDEAQAMPPASMEEIKLLSNLETAQHKLLQIVLFGQPEIEATLTVPQLRQVRDRVVNRFVIPPLNIEDARRYVEHRLTCAGSGGRTLFEENALLLLARLGRGSMRRLNILADQALLAAFADGSTCVRTPHVRKAALSLPYPDHARRWRTPAAWAWALGGAASAAAVVAVLWLRQDAPTNEGVTTATTGVSHGPSARTEAATAPQQPAPQRPAAADTPDDPSASATLAARYAHLPHDVRTLVLQSRASLDNPAVGGYTLQIATLTNSLDARQWLAMDWPRDWPLWLHDREYPKAGRVWALYAGHFAQREQAQAALEQLPRPARNLGAFVRTLSGIRSERYPDSAPKQ